MKFQRIHNVDEIRGLAIGLVLVYHLHEYAIQLKGSTLPLLAAPWLQQFLGLLWVGVDLFYVLSGFLICTVVMRATNWEPAKFAMSRVRRIVPAYFISIFFCVIFLESSLLLSTQGWVNIGLHLVFLHTMQEWSMFSINGPFWTLGIEFSFYILMLLLLGLLWRSSGRWWLVLGMLGASWLWKMGVFYGIPEEKRFFNSIQLPGALDEFAIGCSVAVALYSGKLNWLHDKRIARMVLQCVALGFFASTTLYIMRHATVYWQSFPLVVFGKTAYCLAFGLLIAARVTAPASHWSFQPLAALGQVSYSIYLYHVPALLIVHRLWPSTSIARWALMSLAITALLSCVSYIFVEKKFSLKSSS